MGSSMAPTFVRTPPPWFRIVAALFLLWGVAGVFAFYSQVTMGPAALAAMGEADRRFYTSLPRWFAWVYGIATWGGLLGSIALLLGRRWAGPVDRGQEHRPHGRHLRADQHAGARFRGAHLVEQPLAAADDVLGIVQPRVVADDRLQPRLAHRCRQSGVLFNTGASPIG